MLDQTTRTAILRLGDEGLGARAIAQALGISRGAVKREFRAGTAEVTARLRSELFEPCREQIVELYASTKGNCARAHEELCLLGHRAVVLGADGVPSAARHRLRSAAASGPLRLRARAGDAARHPPHQALVAGRSAKLQTAALAMAHSRMRFFRYTRVLHASSAKFFDRGAQVFRGACERCMIDNMTPTMVGVFVFCASGWP